MSDDINKKISIDVEITQTGQQQLDQYKSAFVDLRNSISAITSPLNSMSKTLSMLDQDVTELGKSVGKLSSQNKEVPGFFEKLTQAVEKLLSNQKTLKEASDMFIKAIDMIKKGLVTLEASLTAGLSILAVFGPEILEWVTSLFKGKEALDQVKMSLDSLNKGLESSNYTNAVKQMNEFKVNVGLAKKGLLDKKEILKQYNETLGKTMGQVSDLDQAEAEMNAKGGAYIKMTLLKASAQSALQNATKKFTEAQQDQLKSDDDVLTFWDKTKDILQRGINSIADPGMTGGASVQAIIDKAAVATKRRKEQYEEAMKEGNAQLVAFSKLETQAANISKKFKLDSQNGQRYPGNIPPGNNNSKKQLQEYFNQSEQIQKDSLSRQLQTTYSAYGAEAKAADDHYNDELKKLKALLDNKQITRQEYDKVNQQLQNERHAAIAALADKYNEQDAKNLQQAINQLNELKIKGMQAGADKEIAELKQQQQEREQLFDQADKENKHRVEQLNAEMAAAIKNDPNADVSALQQQLTTQQNIIALNDQKRIEEERQTVAAIKKIRDTEKENALIKTDQKEIQKAEKPEEKQAAEKKLVTDKYQFEMEQAQANSAKVAELSEARNNELKDIDDKYQKEKTEKAKKAAQERKDFELQTAKQLSSAAFSFITNGIKSQTDSKIKQLEADKTAELKNTSLTAAQKQAIQDSYQKKEAAVKAKAFKEEQLASIAQAVINGALAITKASAQTGVLSAFAIPAIIAETAIQVATISAQKPPAYARGGLHYTSDGRGGVLPGYSRTDDTNAYLRSGEGIVVSEAMRQPWARNLVSAINVGFGGRDFSIANPGRGYAVGGIFTDGGDANRYYNQPVTDQKNLANSIAYQMINNFPPVYVDVKDINNQQNILAQTINRVNL